MSSGSLGVADIVGIAVGGVLALATVVGLAFSFYAMCCKKNNSPQVYPQQGQYPPYNPQNGAYGQQMNTGYYQQYPPYQQGHGSYNKQSMGYDQPPSYSVANTVEYTIVFILKYRSESSADILNRVSILDQNWHSQREFDLLKQTILQSNAFEKEIWSKQKWFKNENNLTCVSSTANRNEIPKRELNQNLKNVEKVELDYPAISITLEKVSGKHLAGKHLYQPNGVRIRFPELNINQSTIINLMTLPLSSIVSLTLHNQHGEVLDIKNTAKPFEILIPRPLTSAISSAMFRQNVTLLSNKSEFTFYHINLTHHVNLSISLHVEFEPEDKDLSYLFIIRFNGVPNLRTNLVDDSKLLCPKDRKNNSLKYIYFLPNTLISHHQWAVLGIRELKKCKINGQHGDNRFSSDYSIRMYTSGCYYLHKDQTWQSDGLTVGKESNERFTQCYSTHLTTFASGFVILPNPIEFNGDFSIERNYIIYITLIVIGLLYVVTIAFSRRKDLFDAKMLMVIPLLDNNPRDTYLYQLVVFTGMRANAGTKSKVHFILSGDKDNTNIRTLTADRQILGRGQADSFIMAVQRPLGQLNYLRIWHDNSGFDSDASWYLKYILVRNLQTMETDYFICEKWLAVEKGSGEIDRTLTVASEFEQHELKYTLSKNAYRSMADNHLWFSIFAYHLPSANRFTRVQRCTCCFVLLFISLLMNILYYDVKENLTQDELDEFGLTIGPFHISKEEVSIGVMVELIIFLPSLFLVTLFRRIKLRHPRTISPLGEALHTIRAKRSQLPSEIPSKKKKFLLPWWFLIIAYFLSFLMAATSVVFILFASVRMGNEKVQQWLGAILASFCTSVLITQPLKVLSLAILFMCICRKKEQEEAFIEQEDPVEDFTISTTDAHRKFPPKSILAKTRLDSYHSKRQKDLLNHLRLIRLREVKAWFILRELSLLLIFLAVLYAISYANRDIEQSHRMVHYLRREFLSPDRRYGKQPNSGHKNVTHISETIRSIDDYWKWLELVFPIKYHKTMWKYKENSRTLLLQHTRANHVIGWPILRQLRVKNDSCPRKVLRNRMEVDDCNLPYTWYNQATAPFGDNLHSVTSEKFLHSFQYKPSEDKTLIYSTAHATYLAGGYVHEIQGMTIPQIRAGFENLRAHHWIDRYTRAVFLTFGLYNPDANLFVYCSFLLEQLPVTKTITFQASFQPFKLVKLYTGTELIYCLIYLALIIYYMVIEVRLFLSTRQKYVKQFWSYINWGIIVCSWFGIVIHVLRQIEMKKMAKTLTQTKGHKPINLQIFSYLDNLLNYLLGFCCFFGTLKLLCLLRFNRRLSLLHLTLKRCARQLLGFLLMFSIVFIAFVSLYYLLFHAYVKEYSSWSETSWSCFEMIALHFTTIYELSHLNAFIAGISLFLFVFLGVFMLSNMFISIIVDNFNKLRQEQLKQENEVELIQFMTTKTKRWLGLQSYKDELEKTKNPVTEFPEKIDRLMIAIGKV
ncbi:unnamed protein product [Adineta ricciae]|uniref:PLAT domain-containing protein n=1 Tax=Adineta ricciae TaxID=249248 RepID=A0A814YXR0_ADIRI|nr:unnamed protein product [Adineta ricciae]